MLRAVQAVLACAVLLLTLSGCNTGAHEIDDLGYVFMIGIDQGVSDKLRFTFMMPTFSGSRGNGGGSGTGGAQSGAESETMETMTIDAATFFSAQTLFSSSLSRALNFAHTKYLVISEDLARDGVEAFMNGMVRSYQLRRNLYILVTRGTAAGFIREFKPKLGASVSKSMELMMMNGDETELFNIETYNDFLISMKNMGSQPATTLVAINDFSEFRESGPQEKGFKSSGQYTAGELPRTGGNAYEFCGAAVFNGPKMVGTLTADETRAMDLLRGEFHTAQIVIPDPKNPDLRVGVEIKKQKAPRIKITYKDRNPVISVKVFLEGALQNVQSTEEYEWAKKDELEKAIEKFIKDLLDRTVAKCKELNSEVFRFGDKAVRDFLTIQAWDEYKWVSHFKDAEVSTEVDFIMRRTGSMTKTEKSVTA